MSKINKIRIEDVSYDIEDLSIGDLNELETTDKSNLVNAINEVLSNVGSGESGGSGITELTENCSLQYGDAGLYKNASNKLIYVAIQNSYIPTNESSGVPIYQNEIFLLNVINITKRILIKFTNGVIRIYYENTRYYGTINSGQAQSISGLKTFNTLPQCNLTPSNEKDLVNKKYVDDAIASLKAELTS